MIPTQNRGRRRRLLSAAAAAFLVVWIGGVVALISSSGERGADDRSALVARATDALRAGDGQGLHALLLDAPDTEFAVDYASRVREAGAAELATTGPDAVEIRAGALRASLSVAEEGGRWYLSLLPPQP